MTTFWTSVWGKQYCPNLYLLVGFLEEFPFSTRFPSNSTFTQALSATVSLPILSHPGWSSHSSDHLAPLCLYSDCYICPFLPSVEIISTMQRQSGYLVHGASPAHPSWNNVSFLCFPKMQTLPQRYLPQYFSHPTSYNNYLYSCLFPHQSVSETGNHIFYSF